jgi:hypothetical protein
MKRFAALGGLRLCTAILFASVSSYSLCRAGEPAPAKPANLPAGLPAAILSPEAVAARQAEVKVEFAEWDKLKAGSECYGSTAKYQWSDIPTGLEGVRWTKHPFHAATLQFTVTQPGMVFMAVTTRFAEGGVGGDWQKELINAQGLEKQGWRKLPEFDKLANTDVKWVVYYKECTAGESHSFRTEKYVAPILLMR